MATQLVIKAHDTYPPVTASLSDNNGFIDLTSTTSIKFIMKGATVLVTGTATKATTATITGSTTTGSPTLTAVSAFTNVFIGSSLIGTGIPAGATVGSYDSVAATINMVDSNGAPLNAIATGTAISITLNRGTVQYTWGATDTGTADTYAVEWELTWAAGQIQTVPNDSANNGSIKIVADLENA